MEHILVCGRPECKKLFYVKLKYAEKTSYYCINVKICVDDSRNGDDDDDHDHDDDEDNHDDHDYNDMLEQTFQVGRQLCLAFVDSRSTQLLIFVLVWVTWI